MKKLVISVILLVAVVLTAVVIPVTAAGEPAFKVGDVTVPAGESVDLELRIINNPGVASVKLVLTFDDASLTLNAVTFNTALGGQSMQPQKLTSPTTLNWYNGSANTNGDMVFATLSFTASASASGHYPVSVTYNPNDVYDMSETNVAFAVENGSVTVTGAACVHSYNGAVDAGNGRHRQVCALCGDEKYSAHSCKTTVTPPTCLDGGYSSHVCECGYTYIDTRVSAPGHVWDGGVPSGNSVTYHCTVCGDAFKQPVVLTGDVDASGKVDAADLIIMAQYLAEMLKSFPADE